MKKEENKELTKQKSCCIFEYPTVEEAAKNIDKQLITVEDYGSEHLSLYDLDYGDRKLMECKKCEALLLRQYSYTPCYYDGNPLTSLVYYGCSSDEALEINKKHDGFEFEYKYMKDTGNMWIKCSDNRKWSWSKGEEKRKEMEYIVLEAACILAKELHEGQFDKAGKDYFSVHLCTVAEKCVHWTEKVVGYLHDAAEDTQFSVKQLMQMLKARCGGQLNKNDAKDIEEALELLNSKTASSRAEYINRLCQNTMAAHVKMHDLENNMDISRIENPTKKDFARVERYKKEYEQVYKAYSQMIDKRIDKNPGAIFFSV